MTFFKHIKKIELAVLLISNFEIDDHTSVDFWYLKKHIFFCHYNMPFNGPDILPTYYDDVDILPSISSLNESYPEIYGDQCLS